jgi:hypothetical protein
MLNFNRIAIASIMLLIMVSIVPVFTASAQAPEGSITGVVLDRMGSNIPNATVTLLKDGQLFDTFRNPQLSSPVADPQITMGRYQFSRLPYGQYTINAKKHDAAGIIHEANLSVNLIENTTVADIVITDLVFVERGVIVTPSPLPSASPVPSPSPMPLSGIGLVLLILGTGGLMIHKKKIK